MILLHINANALVGSSYDTSKYFKTNSSTVTDSLEKDVILEMLFNIFEWTERWKSASSLI